MTELKKYLTGTIFLIVLVWGLATAISLKLINFDFLTTLINISRNPTLFIWLGSTIAVCSLVLIPAKIGIKLKIFEGLIEKPTEHPIFPYLWGLPLRVMLLVLAISIAGLAFVGRVCESPTAEISVTSLDGSRIDYNGGLLTAPAGSKLTLRASVNDTTRVSCDWTGAGGVIRNIGQKATCTAQLSLSNTPGKGIVTLKLYKSFCETSSTYPIEIVVLP